MAGFYSARVSTKLPLHRPGLSPPCTDPPTILEHLSRAGAATPLDPVPDMGEGHAVLASLERDQAVDSNSAHADVVERLRQDLRQRRQLDALRRPALRHCQAGGRADQLLRPGRQLRIRPALQLRQIGPRLPSRIEGEALIAHATLNLALA